MNLRKIRFLVPCLTAFTVFAAAPARADFSAAPQLLGPSQPGIENYSVGNERLKLKAFLVDSVNLKDVREAVENFRRSRGTHSWEWKINYVDLIAHRNQTLVLSWYNLDSMEQSWIAVTVQANGQWLKASKRKEEWVLFAKKNLIRKDTTNGAIVVSRFSQVSATRAAFAFSRTFDSGEQTD